MSNCRSCGAKLRWVEMMSGKKMPLDIKPMKMVQVKEDLGQVIDVYMPHWATCPGAEKFKKKP